MTMKTHRLRRPLRRGLFVIAALGLCFGGWSALAPLTSAAIAPGAIAPEGAKKSLYHLEGGIVENILIRNGDLVRKGQVVIRMAPTQAVLNLDVLRHQRDATAVEVLRLSAEVVGAKTFPNDFEGPALDLVEEQRRLFEARRVMIKVARKTSEKRLAQLVAEKEGLAAQKKAAENRRVIADDELKSIRPLYEKGFVPRPRLLEISDRIQRLTGEIGAIHAEIAKKDQRRQEILLDLARTENEWRVEAGENLKRARLQLRELNEQLRAARDRYDRLALRSPIKGVIHNLSLNTRGAVVKPGAKLAEVVPDQAPLVVKAKLRPADIDGVGVGQEAQVRLTAFNLRRLPLIQGRVAGLSADLLTDPASGLRYYEAEIHLDDALPKRIRDQMVPGMPAESLIVTGKRTLLAYLTAPLLDGLDRAMREN